MRKVASLAHLMETSQHRNSVGFSQFAGAEMIATPAGAAAGASFQSPRSWMTHAAAVHWRRELARAGLHDAALTYWTSRAVVDGAKAGCSRRLREQPDVDAVFFATTTWRRASLLAAFAAWAGCRSAAVAGFFNAHLTA
jgi:hypothetical protein